MTDPRLDKGPGPWAAIVARLAVWLLPLDRSRRSRPDPETLRSVLVVRTDERVGNALLTIPLALALRALLPRAEVHLLLAARRAELAEGLGLGLVRFERTDAFLHPLRFLRFLRALRKSHDAVVDAAHWHAFSLTSALLSRFAARRWVVGPRRGPAEMYSAAVEPPPEGVTEVPAKLLLVLGLGLAVPPASPLRTRLGEDLGPWAVGVLGGAAVLLNPGARKADHRWPPDRFAALAREIHAQRGLRSIIAWGPGEEELARGVLAMAGASAFVAPPTDLAHLAALLRHASLAVVNDTGPMHLAVACEAPTLALLHAPEGARFTHPGPLFAAAVNPEVGEAFAAAGKLLDTVLTARKPARSFEEGA
jgi:heptosyltransferase III